MKIDYRQLARFAFRSLAWIIIFWVLFVGIGGGIYYLMQWYGEGPVCAVGVSLIAWIWITIDLYWMWSKGINF